MLHRTALTLGSLLALLSSCRVLEVDSGAGPPRIESRGIVESHLALGIPAESHLLHLDLFDGTSEGAVAELTLWKLFHLELGLAGLSVGVGPIHLGLGVLFYEPEVPVMMHAKPARSWREAREWEAEDEGEDDEEADEPAESGELRARDAGPPPRLRS